MHRFMHLACLWFSICVVCSCLLINQPATAQPAVPAILFAGSDGSGCGYEVMKKLADDGFIINRWPGLTDNPLTWEAAKKYHVIVVSGLGYGNADGTLSATNRQTIAVLKQFLEAGGGVLIIPAFGQMAGEAYPQQALYPQLGLTPLFDEMVVDPDGSVKATSWKLPFSYTTDVAVSPVTANVKALWHPVPETRVGGQHHGVTFTVDNNWTVLVRGSASSQTRKGTLQEQAPTGAGTYAGRVPLVASRQFGNGRLLAMAICNSYLYGPVAMTTLEGITPERGLKNLPSGGLTLLLNGLRWLAEPAITAGTLGGAVTDPAILESPYQVRYENPYPWGPHVGFPGIVPAYRGVIGARTYYSTGQSSTDSWVEQAKARGLSFLVFLEDFAALTPAEFTRLKQDCTRLSTPTFAAIPGFTIDDEIGNHYFYCGTSFPYPDAMFLTPNGKTFRSRDTELGPKDPYLPGQLAMTTLDYAYTKCGFRLTAGNYLFSQDAAPFSDFFSDWDAMGVVTAKNGKLLENMTADYLKLVDSGQDPTPMALHLMDDPKYLKNNAWQTVLRLPVQPQEEPAHRIHAYFDEWHFYPNNPTSIFITEGPDIETWCCAGPGDYVGNTRGDFVWQNYLWKLQGKVSAPSGLKEVAIYDGPVLFRRYLPQGKTSFEFILTLAHDQQHNLVLIATDMQGRMAVSGEQWDRNHRIEEVMCSDRNNQLSGGYLNTSDGRRLMIGGSQCLATPNKRISSDASPAGTFRNDLLLGAPAFDGATSSEPPIWENISVLNPAQPVTVPNVNEARRLLHSGDVHIGEGVREHSFTDNIRVANVWHTLWKTAPARELRVSKRNYFFQMNSDSPLAVFLWLIDIELKEDLPNRGFDIASMWSSEDRLWTLRNSAGLTYTGLWEETPRSIPRTLTHPFDRGAYAAFLDSPLGGNAVYPLTDGLQASISLPGHGQLVLRLPEHNAPQRKGDRKRIALLLVGIPRMTEYTKQLPSASTEVVERFYRDFGLDGDQTAYTVQCTAGSMKSRRYVLDIDGQNEQCFSGTLAGSLISSLPITVSNLHDRWSACLYDRTLKRSRPIAMFEGKAWATVNLNGKQDLFIGHPVLADNPDIVLQVTQTGDKSWTMEAHNPTDTPMRVRLWPNPYFDPLKESSFTKTEVIIPAGSSVVQEM